MTPVVLLVMVVFGVAGCARHVVIAPEEVPRYNSPDWIVKSKPTSTETDKKPQ